MRYNPAMQPTQSQTVLLAFIVGVSLLLDRLCRQLWAADRYRYTPIYFNLKPTLQWRIDLVS